MAFFDPFAKGFGDAAPKRHSSNHFSVFFGEGSTPPWMSLVERMVTRRSVSASS